MLGWYPKDNESLDDDFTLTTRKQLILLCGTSELEKITHLQLRPYPAECYMMSKGSKLLTNLSSLFLSGNVSVNLRDLGTSLVGLSELSLAHCHLESLDGIANFPNLTLLQASYNNISDLSPCIYLEKICHLDVERNAIQDTKSLEPLALCSNLMSAIFRGNPFSLRNLNGSLTVREDYEDIIFHFIPQLKYVDRQYCSSADDLGSPLTSQDEKLFQQEPLEASHAIGSSEDHLVRCHSSLEKTAFRNNFLSHDADLFTEEHMLGSSTSFLSDRSETLSTSGKIYCGSPGRAFKSGLGSSSNISTGDVTSADDEHG